MSRFRKKNLMEIDALFDGPEIEMRFARKYLDSEHLGISLFRYAPGFTATDGHHHEVQEEAYVVLGGSGRIRLDDEVVELRRWDVVRVAPETVRGFEAGPDGLEVLAVGRHQPEGGEGAREPAGWPGQGD